ncbi:hypothetical protein [Micromonospora sp. WMMD1155]|uniref:hypothetical protein n=1 Tax=Micromonospora sp. WMMD1155 TaxID=3016094 RepID=UPI00249B3A2A|nr:hypothetical protein [Micromonospora sp. WMMD1155]WFE49242.1 hypothetical protein O7617_02425 [Micromonospora sp. WMMD1155]
MLPVALTCPLWWVARWATRVLTSLAVVAALALGAGPASAAVPQSFAPGTLPATCSSTSTQEGVHEARAVTEQPVEDTSSAWSVDPQPAPPAEQVAVTTGPLPVGVAGSDRLPLGHAPSSRAPRAPPGR